MESKLDEYIHNESYRLAKELNPLGHKYAIEYSMKDIKLGFKTALELNLTLKTFLLMKINNINCKREKLVEIFTKDGVETPIELEHLTIYDENGNILIRSEPAYGNDYIELNYQGLKFIALAGAESESDIVITVESLKSFVNTIT